MKSEIGSSAKQDNASVSKDGGKFHSRRRILAVRVLQLPLGTETGLFVLCLFLKFEGVIREQGTLPIGPGLPSSDTDPACLFLPWGKNLSVCALVEGIRCLTFVLHAVETFCLTREFLKPGLGF